MKKSLKTRLTAAAFAAACAFGLTGCKDVDPGLGEEQDVYGPPVIDPESPDPVEEETTEQTEKTDAEAEPQPPDNSLIQCVYGPPESFQ